MARQMKILGEGQWPTFLQAADPCTTWGPHVPHVSQARTSKNSVHFVQCRELSIRYAYDKPLQRIYVT